MLLEIYIFLAGIGISCMFLSLTTKNVILPFIACIFLLVVGLATFNIEKVTCDYEGGWSCHEYSTGFSSIGYLFMGLGIVMLIYGFFMTFLNLTEDVSKQIDNK